MPTLPVIAKGLKWQMIKLAGGQLMSMTVFMILAKLVAPAALGQVALVSTCTLLAMAFCDFGIGNSILQKESVDDVTLNTAFWFVLSTSVILSLIILISADQIARLLNQPNLAILLRWSTLILVSNCSTLVHQNLMMREMDFRRPAIRQLLATLAGGSVGISLAFSGYGVWALLGQLFANSVVGSAFLWMSSIFKPSLKFSYPTLRSLLNISAPSFAISIVWYINHSMDQYIVGRAGGASTLGQYVVAGKIPSALKGFLINSVGELSISAFSRLQGDHRKLSSMITNATELNAVLMVCAFGGLALISNDVVVLLFGPQWEQAARLCMLLSILALVNGVTNLLYPAFVAVRMLPTLLYLSLGMAASTLVISLFTVQVNLSVMIAGLIVSNVVWGAIYAKRLESAIGLKFGDFISTIRFPLVAGGVMACVYLTVDRLMSTGGPSFFRTSIASLTAGAAYFGFFVIFQPRIISQWLRAVRAAV